MTIIRTNEFESSIESVTNIIQYLINDFDRNQINDGNEKKIGYKNKIVLLTSTYNQKIKE